MRSQWRAVVIGLVGLLAASAGWAQEPAAKGSPRLALVGTDRNPQIANLLTLAEVKLSAGADIEILERKTIDRVLAEQKLSLSGFVKSDQVLQVGKLLGVDLFAVLETDKDKAVGLVVFDARTGVRLWDTSLPTAELDPTVTKVVASVRAASAKFRHQYKDLFTICVTTVRNVDLPRDQDAFCDTVGTLLGRGLVTSPTLVLLERTRLDQVNKERKLPTGAVHAPLLASLVRVELEISREGKGLRGTALLFDSDGKPLGKPSATIAGLDAAALAKALLPELTKALKARPAEGVGDPALEARRLLQESVFFRKHQDPVRAMRALEAANALKPGDVAMRTELGEVYFEVGVEIVRPHRFASQFVTYPSADELRRSLEFMLRGTEAMLDLDRDTPVSLGNFSFRYSHLESYLRTIKNMSQPRIKDLPQPLTDETRALLQKIYDRYQAAIDLFQDRAFEAVKDKKSFEFYTMQMGSRFFVTFGVLHPSRFSGLPLEPYKKNEKRWLTRWLGAAEKHGHPPLTPEAVKCMFALLRDFATLEDADQARAQKFRAALVAADDPYIRLFDQFTQLQIGLDEKKLKTAEERQATVRAFRLEIQKLIQGKEARRDDVLCSTCYIATFDAIHLLRDRIGHKRPYSQELAELCRFMLAQDDLELLVAQATVFFVQDTTREGHMLSLEFADPILRRIDTPDARILANPGFLVNPKVLAAEKARVKSEIARLRQQTVATYPDLERKLVTPWDSIQELIDVTGPKSGIFRFVRPVVHDGAVYVVGLSGERGKDQFIQLLRFSLADGKKTELGKVAVAHLHSSESNIDFAVATRVRFGRAACIHDGRYYLGSDGHGIFVFPLDGGKVERLTTKTGLPSDQVHDLACIADKLFVGLGEENKEGYLAVIDLKTKECKVVASSRRKEKLSPFDDAFPLVSRDFVADPKRNRVLFNVHIHNRFDLSGLWEIDLGSRKLKQHRSIIGFSLEWACTLPGERMLIATDRETIVFDMQTNKSVSRPFKHLDADRSNRSVQPRMKEIIALAKPAKDVPIHLPGGNVIYGDWLWSSYPFGRVTLAGAEKFRFEPARQKYNRYFNPNECFQVLDNGTRILLADQHGIWLARLPRPK